MLFTIRKSRIVDSRTNSITGKSDAPPCVLVNKSYRKAVTSRGGDNLGRVRRSRSRRRSSHDSGQARSLNGAYLTERLLGVTTEVASVSFLNMLEFYVSVQVKVQTIVVNYRYLYRIIKLYARYSGRFTVIKRAEKQLYSHFFRVYCNSSVL